MSILPLFTWYMDFAIHIHGLRTRHKREWYEWSIFWLISMNNKLIFRNPWQAEQANSFEDRLHLFGHNTYQLQYTLILWVEVCNRFKMRMHSSANQYWLFSPGIWWGKWRLNRNKCPHWLHPQTESVKTWPRTCSGHHIEGLLLILYNNMNHSRAGMNVADTTASEQWIGNGITSFSRFKFMIKRLAFERINCLHVRII